MPGNDEREPLEGWLDQRIQPLPPPPGTFELINRRSRRRRLRRAAVTVASGAAVTAGLLVAATNPALLRLSPPAESGQAVAGASSPGAGSSPVNGISQPNGSGRLETSPPASSSPAGPRSPSPGPVPADFAPSSVTFVSPTRAWVIGQAGVPGSCYNGNICTSIAWTPDGGRTWHGQPAPVAGAPGGPNGVSGIRFLDGVSGWAFGPELWSTHDAGNNWHAVDTFGQRVTDLETAGNRAYALFANCSGASGGGFAADCTSFTLMTSPAGSDAWQPAGPETSDLRGGGSAELQLAGDDGYLLAPDGTVYSGAPGGTWTRAGTAPCEPGAPQSDGSPSGALLAAIGPGHLALACAGSSSPAAVFTSGDGGSDWTRSSAVLSPDAAQDSTRSTPEPSPSTAGPESPEPSAPEPAPPAGSSSPAESASTATYVSGTGKPTYLAASPDGTLVLATTNGIYSLAPGASQWRPAATASGDGLPGGGFSYVGMTSGSDGVALPADTSLHEIWITSDGGRTWTPRPVE